MNQMTLDYQDDHNSPYFRGKQRSDCVGCFKEFLDSDLDDNELCFECALEKAEEAEIERTFGDK